MATVTKRKHGLLRARLRALTTAGLARLRAKQTLAEAVALALPAPHKTMLRRGFGAHLNRRLYVVAGVSTVTTAGADEAALNRDAALVKTLRRQYPAKLQAAPEMWPAYIRLQQLCSGRMTEAKLVAKAPELAALVEDAMWATADKPKLRRALLKAGWPIP